MSPARGGQHDLRQRGAGTGAGLFTAVLSLALLLMGALGPAAAAAAGPGAPPGSGPWTWPLPGRPPVLRPFQPPPGPYAPGHRGVDLGAAIGTPVRAAGAGVVGFSGRIAGRGVVTVLHGALRTTYEPVTAVVHAGQPVTLGQQIGWLAAPTGHCGPGVSCLHWGLLRGSVYLNPLSLLGPIPVRLLPSGPAAAAPVTGAVRIGRSRAATGADGLSIPGGTQTQPPSDLLLGATVPDSRRVRSSGAPAMAAAPPGTAVRGHDSTHAVPGAGAAGPLAAGAVGAVALVVLVGLAGVLGVAGVLGQNGAGMLLRRRPYGAAASMEAAADTSSDTREPGG